MDCNRGGGGPVMICAVSSENNAIASAQINGMTIQIL